MIITYDDHSCRFYFFGTRGSQQYNMNAGVRHDLLPVIVLSTWNERSLDYYRLTLLT